MNEIHYAILIIASVLDGGLAIWCLLDKTNHKFFRIANFILYSGISAWIAIITFYHFINR